MHIYPLIVLHVIGVYCQKCLKPESVLTCPRSSNAWLIESRQKCQNSDHYHCLETDTQTSDIQTFIECCMSPLNISKGHRPRYTSRKNVIQEIPCEDDFFMPYDYSSSSYHDNGPSHCKVQKGSCTGDEMNMCSTGTTTRDITFYCDHTKNYVPRLLSTSPCFFQFENECMVTSSCNVIIEYRVKLMYSTESQCKTTTSYETTSEFLLTTDNAFNTIMTISNSVSDDSQVKKDSNFSNERLLLIIHILSAILAVLLSCITVYFVKNTIEKKDQTANVLRIHDIGENQESQYVEMHANLNTNNECIPVTSIGTENISVGTMFEMQSHMTIASSVTSKSVRTRLNENGNSPSQAINEPGYTNPYQHLINDSSQCEHPYID